MKIHLLIFISLALLLSCSSGNNMPTEEVPINESASQYSVFPKLAKSDTIQMLVKTAGVKIEVKNVAQAVIQIEKIIADLGGIIESSRTYNNVNNTKTKSLNSNYILSTRFITTLCSMTLRVPSNLLDSTINSITALANYVDYRILSTKNVLLEMLSLNQKAQRFNEQEKLLNEQAKTGTTSSELHTRTELADNVKLEQMRLDDMIKYSTIELTMYQPMTSQHDKLVDIYDTSAYEDSFGSQVIEALKIGWSGLLVVIITLLQVWWLFIITGIIILSIRYNNKRRADKKNKNRQ